MDGTIVVFGFGATGRATAALLLARGTPVRIVQRNRPDPMPAGAGFRSGDILDRDSVRRAIAGASQVLLAVSFPYDSRVWRTAWPRAMANLLDACAETGARIVFVDNLYQLGPRNEPRREDMALSDRGRKPAILSGVTRLWMNDRARNRLAALRCPDFYGPGVRTSHLGATGFGRLARNRRAFLIAPPDTPHDFAFVPDIGRPAVALLDAPDDAFNQSWNVPCAPTRTPREILALGAAALGLPLRLLALPLPLLRPLGLLSRWSRELADVAFTFDRPYIVDGGKFRRRFGFDATPFEAGAPATARSFLPDPR